MSPKIKKRGVNLCVKIGRIGYFNYFLVSGTMSLLHVKSKVCMAPFNIRSEGCIAPFHVQRTFCNFLSQMDCSNEIFAPHMEGSHAEFAPHMEGSHAEFAPHMEQRNISGTKTLLKLLKLPFLFFLLLFSNLLYL